MPIDHDAAAHSAAAYAGLARTDPQAVWVYQTWIWRGFTAEHEPYALAHAFAPLSLLVVLVVLHTFISFIALHFADNGGRRGVTLSAWDAGTSEDGCRPSRKAGA